VLGLQADETVLVIGQGPIGILLATLAKRKGATVLTSDWYAERHAVAAGLGCIIRWMAGSDVIAECKAVTEGRGADVASAGGGARTL